MSDNGAESRFPRLTPYIVTKDAAAAIAFYEKAFGAVARDIAKTPDGSKIMNAQLVFGNSVLMLNDEFPEYGAFGPQPDAPLPITIHIDSQNVDAEWERAVAAGCEVTMPLADMFWGDRYGQLRCPFGYRWSMGQKVASPSDEEMMEGARKAMEEN
ncbi:MAG: hypothetical protein BGO01_08435 [Armatimonadetes bacterium 55-13]|nr:VOC family protein [Armatimonadota bacterium]OJU62495.1 MAG: hypothetical protein BGO01_08435 [Armatimonadetes bacterium 55-13]